MFSKIWIAKQLMNAFFHRQPMEQVNYWEGVGGKPVRAQEAYEHETQVGFDGYFQIPILDRLRGEFVLDIGCGHAGRTVRWIEKYHLSKAVGVDMSEKHLQWAKSFIRQKEVRNIMLAQSAIEYLPFRDETIDSILSFDVLEHVDDATACMKECYRVLKRRGIMAVVFNPYYSPTGTHLPFTSAPWLNVLFSEKTLIEAHNQIARSLGRKYYEIYSFHPNCQRYGNSNKLGSVNGITVKEFDRIVVQQGWDVVDKWDVPILGHGMIVRKNKRLKYFGFPFRVLTKLPITRELFTHRVSRILRKE